MKDTIIKVFIYLRIGGVVLSLFFLGGIIYYFKKLHIVWKWKNKLYSKIGVSTFEALANLEKKKWKHIFILLKEPYQSSWKLATLQADGVIDRTLDYLQLKGDTFNQRIESLRKQGYKNLDLILQYHDSVQNILVDQNLNLALSKARTICTIYQKFWQELIQYLSR